MYAWNFTATEIGGIMNCPSCGKTNPDESQFCNYCGTPISTSSEENGVQVSCARCSGSGKNSGMFGASDCPACKGQGHVRVAAPPTKCPLCKGSGRQEGFINKAVCGVCWGTGWANVLK